MSDETSTVASGTTGHRRSYGAAGPPGLAQRIRSARHAAGLTQKEAAKRLGVSAGAVGQWETGGVPSTDRLAALGDLFDVSLDWLLGRSQKPSMSAEENAYTLADLRLIAEARELGLDLHAVVAEARQQRWLRQNHDALSDANSFLLRHGLWSDGKRQF